jgi:hypothetical protein
VTQNVGSTYNLSCSDLSAGGIFSSNTIFRAKDINGNVLTNVAMLAGQTIADLMLAVNPITDTQGNTGDMFVQANPNSLAGKDYDFIFTLDSVARFEFLTGLTVGDTSVSLVSFVLNNPFIFVEGVVPITTIQQSETGNSYRVMGVDIISGNPNQLLEDINYGNKEADGNRWSASFTPIIDPYQANAISLHGIGGGGKATGAPMDDFTINTDTTFSYTVLATTYSRLTFNYVRASLASMKEFDQALTSELVMRFSKESRYLESLKYRKGVFLQ